MNPKEGLISGLKRALYFPIALYFRFFAKIKLARWNPRIIVITGSSGKTTTMGLVESQLGDKAHYSHHANSAYGIPFNILGLTRKTLLPSEWLLLFLLTPIMALSKVPHRKIYIVEADCDRPGEGAFLSNLLKPEVTIWLSSSRTHSMNFDHLVSQSQFPNVEEAIAYEYGYFIEKTSMLLILNVNSELINKQLPRAGAQKIGISNESLQEYKVSRNGSSFKINDKVYSFKFLLPKAISYSIAATLELTNYLNLPFSNEFFKFEPPPGRSGIFKGIKNTTIIDSSYNTGLGAYFEILNMFDKIDINKKWAVVGDILEQGMEEQEEHEKLAREILKLKLDRIILLGPRVIKYTRPILEKGRIKNIASFENPKGVLDYLEKNLKGEETILFKGARFLEGVIEHLLKNKSDVYKLARRERVWKIRREKWGL